MKAMKCDRCEAFYMIKDSETITGLSYTLNTSKEGEEFFESIFSYFTDNRTIAHSKRIDLCPDCAKKLVKWVYGDKND